MAKHRARQTNAGSTENILETQEAPSQPLDAVVSVPLITCTVTEPFKDGATFARFAALGYKGEWPAGENRSITVELFRKCKSSGAKLVVVQ